MKNFSEIDLNEGILDSTSSKIKDVKKVSKEMVARKKIAEKIGQLSWLVNEFEYFWNKSKEKATNGQRDVMGKQIQYGDFILYSQLDNWDSAYLGYGFVVSDQLPDNRYKVMFIAGDPDLDLEDPFDACATMEYPASNILVVSRIDDLKTSYKTLLKSLK